MPEEIGEKRFSVVRRGYDREEVEEYLLQVAADVAMLRQQIADRAVAGDRSDADGSSEWGVSAYPMSAEQEA